MHYHLNHLSPRFQRGTFGITSAGFGHPSSSHPIKQSQSTEGYSKYCPSQKKITYWSFPFLAHQPREKEQSHSCQLYGIYIQTHTHLTALCPGLPGWAGTRKAKPIWILLKQETVSGSGISWAICKSAHRSRQITMPTPHHSVFYRPDALPAAQPTVSKH